MLIAITLLAAAAQAKPPTPDQVAAAVDTSFPSYDLNGDGQLSPAEFAAMMTRLKARGARVPIAQAFRAADQDRSRAVTKAELTTFFREASAKG